MQSSQMKLYKFYKHWEIKMKSEDTVLVIVDVQERLANVMHKKSHLFENLGKLIKGIKVFNLAILWLEQYPEGLGHTINEIRPLLDDMETIEKITFSAYDSTTFKRKLHELKPANVLVCGIETHICVYQTVRDLITAGYHVEVVADAVSSRTEDNLRIGLDKMCKLGAFKTSVEMVLFELVKIAKGDQFKKILKIVK